jgi:nitrogen fixation NifU-like protein
LSELNELYQSIILDHNRRPRNFGELAAATGTAHGKNPLCGDEVFVWVKLDGDLIQDIAWRGSGCAISRAAASLMSAEVKGKSRQQAATVFERFHQVVTGRVKQEEAASMEKSIAVFSGVSKFPVRVKCAVLPWHTLNAALAGNTSAEATVTSEHEGPEGAVTGGGA